MNALTSARLRRQLPMFAAVATVAIFAAVHGFGFAPLAERYKRSLQTAATLGLMVDPQHPAAQMPLSPRLFRLIADNSLPASEATMRSQSGELTAAMLQALSGVASRHGLETVVAEPGLLTQQNGTLELRAHLRLRGHYTELVSMLDELTRSGKLYAIERFSIQPSEAGAEDIELWIAGCVVKRSGGAK